MGGTTGRDLRSANRGVAGRRTAPVTLPGTPDPVQLLDAPIGRSGLPGAATIARRGRRLGILRVRDLLFHLPRRYEDLREMRQLGELLLVPDGEAISARVRVVDLRVELGRRPALLGGPPRGPRTLRLRTPIVTDLAGLRAALRDGGRRTRTLDATWPVADGAAGLGAALDRLATDALAAAASGVEILIVSDAALSVDRLPVPSILAAGAVHTALTGAGLRGRTDVVADAADILDVHAMAMVLAVGATAAHPRLAVALAAELAGSRAAETVTAGGAS